MQEMGLEPTRCCQRQILSLMRLPFRHSCRYFVDRGYINILKKVLQAFFKGKQFVNYIFMK